MRCYLLTLQVNYSSYCKNTEKNISPLLYKFFFIIQKGECLYDSHSSNCKKSAPRGALLNYCYFKNTTILLSLV